jgi:hypothetical protein
VTDEAGSAAVDIPVGADIALRDRAHTGEDALLP